MLSALSKWLVNASAKLSVGQRRQLTLHGTATSSTALAPHSQDEPHCQRAQEQKDAPRPPRATLWRCRRQTSTLSNREKITDHWFCSLVVHEQVFSWPLTSCGTEGQSPNLLEC